MAAHAAEMGHDASKEEPFFFQKNPDSVTDLAELASKRVGKAIPFLDWAAVPKTYPLWVAQYPNYEASSVKQSPRWGDCSEKAQASTTTSGASRPLSTSCSTAARRRSVAS